MREFPAGWSTQSKLSRAQQLWLDPHRQHQDSPFREEREKNEWQAEIAGDFANWLNKQLSVKDKLMMGDIIHFFLLFS